MNKKVLVNVGCAVVGALLGIGGAQLYEKLRSDESVDDCCGNECCRDGNVESDDEVAGEDNDSDSKVQVTLF